MFLHGVSDATYVDSTGEPRRRLPPVLAPTAPNISSSTTLVVEAESEATVVTFTARLQLRVHRLRPDIDPGDVQVQLQWDVR